MIETDSDALDLALALYSTPHQSLSLEDRQPAVGTLELIRIVAGDEVAIANAQARSGRPRRTVIDAAVLYIQQALFHDAADSYRLLGVSSDTNDETIKEHYRWLMRWLHPDRNPDRWVVAYSERVNRAWNSLSSADRRRNYDQQVRSVARRDETEASPSRARVRVRHSGSRATHRLEPPKFRRRLPVFVLGGLSAVCGVLLYLLQVQQSSEREASLLLAKRLGSQGAIGETSAQDEAIRQRLEFEEHVIELSQPVLPARSGKLQPVTPGDVARRAGIPAEVSLANSPKLQSRNSQGVLAQSAKITSLSAAPVAATVSIPDPKVVARRALIVASTIAIPSAGAAPVHAPATVPAASTNPVPTARPPVETAVALSQATMTHAATATNGSGGGPAVKASEKSPALVIAADSGPSAQDATKLVPRAFEDAYAKGDLAQMMELFAPTAINNRGGVDAISQDYDHLFRESGKRELRLVGLNWAIQPDRIVGNGTFEALILHDGAPPKQARGWIAIEAILLNGHWKILRLLHGNSQ